MRPYPIPHAHHYSGAPAQHYNGPPNQGFIGMQPGNHAGGGQPKFTPTQYNQIVQMLNKENANEGPAAANTAGTITTFNVSEILNRWIVDTGATHHMASDLAMLYTACEQQHQKVHLPNGTKVPITHIGSCRLLQGDIQNVLCVPDFKHNLLSVSKLTRELGCCVAFFPDFCLLQDLFTGKVRGIGKLEGGLYYWDHKVGRHCASASSVAVTKPDAELWH